MRQVMQGKFVLHPVKFEPNAIVNRVIKMFKQQGRQKGIKIFGQVHSYLAKPFEEEAAEEENQLLSQNDVNGPLSECIFDNLMEYSLPCLYGDKIRLQQVIINLIKNAMKHTTRGYICINYSYNYVESMLVVHVQDTGCGIEQDGIERLFKRFSKLEDPDRVNDEGIGLGLAICLEIIQANQGQIQVTSNGPDRGTKVIFSMMMKSIARDEISNHTATVNDSDESHRNHQHESVHQHAYSSPS